MIVREPASNPGTEVERSLERVAANDAHLCAWVFVDANARPAVDGPLAGMPFGVKDIIDVRGMPTAFGIPKAGTVATVDAWAVAALRAAGAVPLGKTETTAFAWRDPARTRNPHDANATPGGSSAGSAAAVADGHVPFALGTQTFGSVLRPAAFCGVVGYKPTYATIPVQGVSPLCPSVDHVGVIARDVATAADVARVFGVTRDVLSGPPRLGFAPAVFADRLSEEVRAALADAAHVSRAAGADVTTIAMPGSFADSVPYLLDLVGSEARAVLVPHLDSTLPPEIRTMIGGETTHDRQNRENALGVRGEHIAEIEAALDPFDAVLLVVADTAPARETTGDSVPQGATTFYGLPAIALPFARSARGLPIGVQLIARRGNDARLLATAAWLETVFAK